MTGFINAAITNDYKTEKSAPVKTKVKTQKSNIADVDKQAEAARRAEKQARAKRTEVLKSWLETLEKSRQDAILARFVEILDKDFLRVDYAKQGLDAPLIANRFTKYIEVNGLKEQILIS